jgi:hypothetical protein
LNSSCRGTAKQIRRYESRLGLREDVMSGLMEQLSKVRAEAAECALVGNLATDPQKKQMYMRLADHLTTLAAEVERAARERVPAE